MSDEILVKCENVSKKFCRGLKRSLLYGVQDICAELNPFQSSKATETTNNQPKLRKDEFWAVKDITFELKRGECLGLIGHNGAGKSTLLKILYGLIKPNHGRITMKGRIGALIELNAGFNPILTGRENVYIYGTILGFTKKEIDQKYRTIIDFAEIHDFMEMPYRSYSSGMKVRLGFAVAAQMEPDVLIIDEVLAVGDVGFRAKCFKQIAKLLQNAAVIFVSHNEAQVSRICNKTLLIDLGKPIYLGNTSTAINLYRDRMDLSLNQQHRLLKNSSVVKVEVPNHVMAVEWGNKLHLKIKLVTLNDIYVNNIYVHISQGGEFVLNSEIVYKSGKCLHLVKGEQTLFFMIGPIFLVHGSYQLSVSMFNENGKNTVFQALYIANFRVVGPTGSGTKSLIPMELKVNN